MKTTKFSRNSVALAAALAAFQMGAQAQTSNTTTLDLDQVVVTGTATRNTKMKQSVSISTLSTESLQLSAPQNSAEALRSIPGVRAESTGGEGNANINVRGLPSPDGGARYYQFQEDGLPVLLFGDIMFGTADTFIRTDYSLDRIEVLRGGSASTAASNAPGAIFNYITKDGRETGGSVGLTLGLNFNRTRFDGEYGGKFNSDTRYYVAGYYRVGEGPRDSGKNAEKGGLLRGNVTHDLGKGSYAKLNFKLLDDQVPTYLPGPMARVGSDGFTNLPGVNALTYYGMPRNLTSVSTDAYGNKVTRSGNSGISSKVFSVGPEISLNLDGGWKLDEKLRISKIDGGWMGMFAPNGGSANPSNGTVASLTSSWGGAGATGRINGVTVAGTTAAQVGHLFNVDVNNLNNIVNDFKMSKSFKLDGSSKLDTNFGLFAMQQNIKMSWNWSSYLMTLENSPRVIDIYNASGARVGASSGTGFANGAAVWGNCCVQAYDLKYTQLAPYTAVAYESGSLNADASLRLDRLSGSGSRNDGARIDYTVTKPSVSVGGNYRLNNDISLFGRISQGHRFNADRFVGNAAIRANGTLANETPAVDDVKQYEFGTKLRAGNFNLFSTAFLSKASINSYDPTKSNPVISQGYDAKGLELEAGYRAGNFRLNAGTTFINATIVGGVNDGHQPQRQAKMVAQIIPSYSLGDFTIGGSLQHTAKSYAGDDNTFVMPAYSIVNMLATYNINKQLTASISANNLFNKLGVTEVHGVGANTISLRTTTGRTFQASLKYSF